MRERETERQRERETERDRQRHRVTETETGWGGERQRHTETREKQRQRQRQRERESAATAESPGAVPLQSTYPTDDHYDSSQYQGQDLRQYVVTVPVLAGCYGDQSDHQQEGAQGLWNPGHGD